MSAANESGRSGTAAFTDAADTYAKFWSAFASRMTGAAFAASPGSAPPEAAREVRSALLKAMSDSFEQYMRSPQFQEALKEWFANSIQYRSQMNEWLSRARHELQGVSRQDVDAVIQAIGRLETRTAEQFEALSERLTALEAQGRAAARPTPPGKPSEKHGPRTRKEKP